MKVMLRMILLVLDWEIRHALCRRHGHKNYVGSSGYYVGMPQANCWRCGIPSAYDNRDGQLTWHFPLGGWFD